MNCFNAFHRQLCTEKGFTLIELVIFIIIGGIILPTSMVAFTTVMSSFSAPDYHAKARFYAERKIEELTSNNYSLIAVGTVDEIPETNFQTRSIVCYVSSIEPKTCASDQSVDTNYKKLSVVIAMPDGNIYSTATLVTRRQNKS